MIPLKILMNYNSNWPRCLFLSFKFTKISSFYWEEINEKQACKIFWKTDSKNIFECTIPEISGEFIGFNSVSHRKPKRSELHARILQKKPYHQWFCIIHNHFNLISTKTIQFFFIFSPEPVSSLKIERYGYHEGTFDVHTNYNVSVTSSIGNDFSEPVIKYFKDCDAIREPTYKNIDELWIELTNIGFFVSWIYQRIALLCDNKVSWV